MDAARIIYAAIPNAPDFVVDHIIWGRTPYPFAEVTAKSLYKAASRYKRASDNGIQLCDLCDRPAIANDLCNICRTALDKVINRKKLSDR